MNKISHAFIKTARVAFEHFASQPAEKKQRGDCQRHSDKKKCAECKPKTAEKFDDTAQNAIDFRHRSEYYESVKNTYLQT